MGNQDESDVRVGKRLKAVSFGSGVYEFIPLPFVDEWAIKKHRKSMIESILKKRGITFEKEVPELLAGGGQSFFSRLGSMGRGLILKPLRKLFRSVLFWMTAKKAARTAMVTYFMARLLHHPGLVAESAGNHLTAERARFVGEVFRGVAKGIDIRAAKDAFGQVVRLFSRPGKASEEQVSRTIEETAPGFIAKFDAMVGERLAAGGDRIAV